MNPIQFLLGIQIKRSKLLSQSGFTLLELLVAMILAVLVITPLLGFMVNILNTDRQEQAKANSEQEIQTALDYIARDLQQAVYIYDATGIDAIKNQLPSPTATDRVPVLVFWKREFIGQAITAADSNKDDTFVYSLVAYYLIKDTSTIWSNAARIARWQIRDGVSSSSTSSVTCNGYTGKFVSGYCPSSGYSSFNFDGVGTLEQKMNSWTRLSSYTTTTTTGGNTSTTTTTVMPDAPLVLVDYIDQTTTGAPSATCPTGYSKVTPTSFNTRDTGNMTGFYACIDRVNTTAQVFLRGNALARLRTTNISYRDSQKNYFPGINIRVQGRGFVFTK
ncbi:prepilin-type N-terminal cleavage/methylation domain-containing protein [Tolypothrix sp. FACHB-123]|uniref:hormogonium polysaccharide secretion pseudopilin HpsC n=1 Tax=Tolypothrix sp. FACHB-123 TaxID=2692868 RepID=UPI001683BC8A|nr:hormogonium polysaccharide secretion pseudopilin HpsC [Tolypothrix sp. FACHB-123]MBD2358167.1 prepilin-type N-terminal cleavage/methylation domain-containing protein [Tolypothrix sp. FACHB-123]